MNKEEQVKTQARWWVPAAAVLGALWLVGCGQKQSESSAPAASPQATAQPAAPSGEAAEKAESGEKITPAGTVSGIWTQIAEEQSKLSTAINNGQLKDVHHLAFGVRDLVVALADKASATSSAMAGKLKSMVDQVKVSAGKLDELGDAGNLSGTQAEFEHLSKVLGAIKTVTAGS